MFVGGSLQHLCATVYFSQSYSGEPCILNNMDTVSVCMQFFPQNNVEEKRQAETRAVMSWIRSIRFTGSASFHEVHQGCSLIRYKAQMLTSTFSWRTPLLLLVLDRPLLCPSCCHIMIGMHLCRIYSYYCMYAFGKQRV